MNTQRYEAYKDSGVDWLGEIPAEWNINKLKYLGKLYSGLSDKSGNDFSKEYKKNFSCFVPFTSVAHSHFIDQSAHQFVKVKPKEKQNKVYKNDILFLMSSETIEDIGRNSIYLGCKENLYLNSFCKGFRVTSQLIEPEFLNYLLQSSPYRNYFSMVGRGFTRINIKQNFVLDNIVIIPPLPEQTAIANYLDDKTAKIDQAITLKEQLIARLKERKQIIIQHAVTKGLDPDAPLKDSGVEWIGEIPAHWEVKKVKHVTNKIGSGITPTGGGSTYLDEGGIPLLRSQNVFFDKIDLTDVARISKKTHQEMQNSQVKKGDVLLHITGGSIGRCYFVNVYEPLNVNQHVCIVRPNRNIDTKFLHLLLASEIGQKQIWFFQQGGGREGLNFQALKNFVIPLPDNKERTYIIEHIKTQSQKIDTAITQQQTQIDHLKEYKATLIDSAVTGKIKVC